MAGEWFQVDCNIDSKPEVLEIADRVDCDIEVVVGRVVRLWAWAQLNCTDGEARVSMRTLCRIAGGDAAFWTAVRDSGWLVLEDQAIVIPRWDERFSQAAKARRLHARRSADSESRRSSAGDPGAQAPGHPAPQRRRGEEMRGEVPPHPPREASPVSTADGWRILRAAWNTGPGKPWKPSGPPDGLAERLAEPGWLDEALEAIPRLQGARYFRTPATLLQFVRPGFVRRLAGGQYDEPKPASPATHGDRPSAEEAARRFEAGSREQARRRREAEAARAGRARGADVPVAQVQTVEEPVDEEFERRRRELLAELKREAS